MPCAHTSSMKEDLSVEQHGPSIALISRVHRCLAFLCSGSRRGCSGSWSLR